MVITLPPPSRPSSPIEKANLSLSTLRRFRLPSRSPVSFRTRSATRASLAVLLLVCVVWVGNEVRCLEYGCLGRVEFYGGGKDGIGEHMGGMVGGGSVIPSSIKGIGKGEEGTKEAGQKEEDRKSVQSKLEANKKTEERKWLEGKILPADNERAGPFGANSVGDRGKGMEAEHGDAVVVGLDKGKMMLKTVEQLEAGRRLDKAEGSIPISPPNETHTENGKLEDGGKSTPDIDSSPPTSTSPPTIAAALPLLNANPSAHTTTNTEDDEGELEWSGRGDDPPLGAIISALAQLKQDTISAPHGNWHQEEGQEDPVRLSGAGMKGATPSILGKNETVRGSEATKDEVIEGENVREAKTVYVGGAGAKMKGIGGAGTGVGLGMVMGALGRGRMGM
ncbi:hypothetical protein P154DRAFT_600362 [Amniculicola lignicola CBS 123094]|uniref:Uncharacterized protein n=1 Tax=Amniculicola lignicola CBS 123094 TaxID=1392246 RepID=A0A6A5X248_9PLEO|nr:hypothetical protein P154DRAFT_600362 [Amniculicola lignicola CBS 123094]